MSFMFYVIAFYVYSLELFLIIIIVIMITLCFATNNVGKLKEIQALLGNTYQVQSLQDIGCTEEIAETGTTIEENSKIKAQYIWEKYGVNCFADDTGLEVAALNNAPGVYSARYAGSECIADDNMKLLLKNLNSSEDKSARFKTVITLVINGVYHTFEGIVSGAIIEEKRGANGFGYDPIFVPKGFTQTFAEMDMETKNSISHRGKAVAALIDFLKK